MEEIKQLIKSYQRQIKDIETNYTGKCGTIDTIAWDVRLENYRLFVLHLKDLEQLQPNQINWDEMQIRKLVRVKLEKLSKNPMDKNKCDYCFTTKELIRLIFGIISQLMKGK